MFPPNLARSVVNRANPANIAIRPLTAANARIAFRSFAVIRDVENVVALSHTHIKESCLWGERRRMYIRRLARCNQRAPYRWFLCRIADQLPARILTQIPVWEIGKRRGDQILPVRAIQEKEVPVARRNSHHFSLLALELSVEQNGVLRVVPIPG